MWLRPLVLLAVIAALLGAPPTASAAANILHAAVVLPSIGTTDTTFVLGVAYQGTFPTTRVDAVVAGSSLPMTRVSGTPAAGSWLVSTTLPAGSWPVTFTATPERGNAPVLAGGSVVVAGLPDPVRTASPSPPPRHGPDPKGDSPAGFTPPDSPAEEDPAPAENTAPIGEPGGGLPTEPGGGLPTEPSAAPTSAPGRPGTTSGPDDDADDRDGAPAGGEDASARATSSAEPTGSPARGVGSSDDPEPNVAPIEDEAAPSEEGTMPDALVGDTVGILAVWGAVLAIAGGLLLLIVVRRRRGMSPEPGAMTLADETAALLQRRALRRARTVMPDDPIASPLGIDEAALARRSTERRRRRRGPDQPG